MVLRKCGAHAASRPMGSIGVHIATKTHPARGGASAHASRIDRLIAGRSPARHQTDMLPNATDEKSAEHHAGPQTFPPNPASGAAGGVTATVKGWEMPRGTRQGRSGRMTESSYPCLEKKTAGERAVRTIG